ncbi:Choline dehydrogenase [Atopomonas hussainii]|uniref:Choline dehydrogenase n=1 Tax=Atopomonas hussainii TaxID=1429083 RepID=A0A1H7GQN5_9GAMM|nr:GMC family oxidoreductase N-terminal domain-containing protein [Atopomonas hussainii]SEK40354.1 Choline dehydrogenase [Atopomonas hussainii]
MEFDYIIVGGGSAGCALAARLSENASNNVLLLEAGKADKSPLIHWPIGVVAMLPRPLYNWAYETVPQPGLNGRRGYQPRGKALGGSSSLNAMIYIRGHQSDYDDWAAAGNPGWGWQDVLPYFLKSENNERGANEWHGDAGPLSVCDGRSGLAASDRFVEAGVQAGYKFNPDFNGADQEGVGLYQLTQKNGRRWSAARAYLGPAEAEKRSNLKVMPESHALRLLLDGKTCTGIEVLQRGQPVTLKARKEVILSAGAFGSPQLLMLSGIGDAEELGRHQIAVQHELPGVGKGLQDHIDYILGYQCPRKDVFGITAGSALKVASEAPKFFAGGRGMMSSNFAEAGGFLRSDKRLKRPDLQLHFGAALVEDHARTLYHDYGIACHVCVLRPKSSGSLRLASANPLDAPLIDPGFLNEEADLELLLKGTRMTQEIMEQSALRDYRGRSLHKEAYLSDEQLRRLIRQRADTVYHPVSTCRMGKDELAVVDHTLRVKGLENLRVVDASVMPTLIGGNTNAPSIMIGEKAADLINNA